MRKLIPVVLIIAFAGIAVGCGTGGSAGGKTATAGKKVYTIDELRKAVLGKTREEVIELLGNPDSASGSDRQTFGYRGTVSNPYTNKNGTVMVEFRGNVAVEVRPL